eukprot:CAMPEP_0206059590 /NCGR_PEP_ID=MMETSP1466-20131121/49401_1 /ASSEMBLY_ACC=CAM_ASM_001126 /TAXON_ID=44452 /ORGANISM="Pavlova gyrans, Strain CCMP608" /LENGTH=546 /DNA_ID=CAMNT_0053434915 /DNA_START=499 /DNA_END=2141 /DNA_ORIENTATION=-
MQSVAVIVALEAVDDVYDDDEQDDTDHPPDDKLHPHIHPPHLVLHLRGALLKVASLVQQVVRLGTELVEGLPLLHQCLHVSFMMPDTSSTSACTRLTLFASDCSPYAPSPPPALLEDAIAPLSPAPAMLRAAMCALLAAGLLASPASGYVQSGRSLPRTAWSRGTPRMMPSDTPRVPFKVPNSEFFQWIGVYDRMARERILFLGRPLDDGVVNSLVATFLYLENEDRKSPVQLYINVPGARTKSGLALYDTMRTMAFPIATVNLGMAAGMGAFIAAAGTKGKRTALPRSVYVLQAPYLDAPAEGTPPIMQAEDIGREASEVLRDRRRVVEGFAELTGQPLEVVERRLKRTSYLDAQEAKAFGLVDNVLSPKGKSGVSAPRLSDELALARERQRPASCARDARGDSRGLAATHLRLSARQHHEQAAAMVLDRDSAAPRAGGAAVGDHRRAPAHLERRAEVMEERDVAGVNATLSTIALRDPSLPASCARVTHVARALGLASSQRLASSGAQAVLRRRPPFTSGAAQSTPAADSGRMRLHAAQLIVIV